MISSERPSPNDGVLQLVEWKEIEPGEVEVVRGSYPNVGLSGTKEVVGMEEERSIMVGLLREEFVIEEERPSIQTVGLHSERVVEPQ